MKAKLTVYTLLGFIVVGLGYVLFTQFEFYEEEIDQGWSHKARKNPYLAAQQFLTRLDTPVQMETNFQFLDQLPYSNTLFISNSRQVITDKQADKIINWMKGGGHIITVASPYDEDEVDLLLSYFDVYQTETDCECDSVSPFRSQNPISDNTQDNDSESGEIQKLSEQMKEHNRKLRETMAKDLAGETIDQKQDSTTEKNAPEQLTQLSFNHYSERLNIQFDRHHSLTHPVMYEDEQTISDPHYPAPFYWRGSDQGTHFMQFEVGKGLLTVMSDGDLWKSFLIDQYDHAYLLKVLTDNSEQVFIVYGVEMPSLWDLTVHYALEFLVAFLLWLTAWLIYRSRRFGPIRQYNVTTRRSIAEHIQACTDFLWRHDQYQQLISSVRQDTLRQMQLHNPLFNQLDKSEQVRLICEKTQLSDKEIQQALFEDIPKNESIFSQTIALLQIIGKKI